MAITVWNTTWYVEAGTVSVVTTSHTVASWSDGILIVAVPESRASDVTAVTYNWVSLTLATSNAVWLNRAYLYYLVNPPVWTYTISVTFSTSLADHIVTAINLYWVDQSSPIWATNSISGTTQNKSISLTTTRANSYLIECFWDQWVTNTPASGQTYILNGANRSSAYSTTTTAGSYTRNWTGNTSLSYSMVIAEIKEAATSSSNFLMFF